MVWPLLQIEVWLGCLALKSSACRHSCCSFIDLIYSVEAHSSGCTRVCKNVTATGGHSGRALTIDVLLFYDQVIGRKWLICCQRSTKFVSKKSQHLLTEIMDLHDIKKTLSHADQDFLVDHRSHKTIRGTKWLCACMRDSS